MLSLARRHSLCVDDAEDAYQRAAEIFLRRADTVRHETAPGWLRTVVKHTYDRRRAADP
jgi:DNA-directed RNA polymerase specialized sigma24 family protein